MSAFLFLFTGKASAGSGPTPGTDFYYRRPGGVFFYRRPDGTSRYIRP